MTALSDPATTPWLLGPLLAFAGVASLTAGIARTIDLPWG